MAAELNTVKKINKNSLATTLNFSSATIAKVTPRYKRKRHLKIPEEMLLIRSHWSASKIFKEVWNMDKIDYCEEMYALFLNGRHLVHAYAHIAEGSINQCQVYIQKILTLALITNSASFIIAHNHPSGNLEASDSDRSLTHRIAEAATLVGLGFLDHLIVSSCPGGQMSIREKYPHLF